MTKTAEETIRTDIPKVCNWLKDHLKMCESVKELHVLVSKKEDDSKMNGTISITMDVKFKADKKLASHETFGNTVYDPVTLKWVDEK